ncbi:MAG: hypothetical protein Fur0012_13850 [Elusimicrobiota bacterium]
MKKVNLILPLLLLALAACNRSPEDLYKKGNKLFSRGNYYGAIESYTRAIMLKNKFPEAITSRGLAYERLGQKQKAVAEYEKSIYVDKNYLPAYNNLAAIYIEGKNYKDAEYYLNEALKINPKYYYAVYSMGLINFLKGDYNFAKYYLENSLKLMETESASYYLALCYEKSGDRNGALNILIPLFRKNPENDVVAYEIARLKFKAGDYSSMEYVTTAIEKNERAEYYALRAQINYSLEDYPSATEDIKKAIEMEAGSNAIHLHLAGEIATVMGDFGTAKAYYDLAYKIHGKSEIYEDDLRTIGMSSGGKIKSGRGYGRK